MSLPCVAIAFTPVGPEENPNVKAVSYDASHVVYLRSMCVAFASVRRWNPDVDLRLVTTVTPPDAVEKRLARLGVGVQLVPFAHRPPSGFGPAFAASLYMLDAVAAMSTDTIFIDPDVLCVGPLSAVVEATRGRAGVLILDTPEAESINGLSLKDSVPIYRELGSTALPRHFGGEFYLLPQSRNDAVVRAAELAWSNALARHRIGLPRFTTEEHIFSYALSGEEVVDVSRHVARIWTSHRYRSVPEGWETLTFWHLPSEKERGLARIYHSMDDPNSWFWATDRTAFMAKASREVGVSRRRLPRWSLDMAGAALNLGARGARAVRGGHGD